MLSSFVRPALCAMPSSRVVLALRCSSSSAASTPPPASSSSSSSSSPCWSPPPSSTPAGTPLPMLQILKDQAPPLTLEDDSYPPWLWKLIGEGKELVKEGKIPADRGPEWELNTRRREVARLNREAIKTRNLLKK